MCFQRRGENGGRKHVSICFQLRGKWGNKAYFHVLSEFGSRGVGRMGEIEIAMCLGKWGKMEVAMCFQRKGEMGKVEVAMCFQCKRERGKWGKWRKRGNLTT